MGHGARTLALLGFLRARRSKTKAHGATGRPAHSRSQLSLPAASGDHEPTAEARTRAQPWGGRATNADRARGASKKKERKGQDNTGRKPTKSHSALVRSTQKKNRTTARHNDTASRPSEQRQNRNPQMPQTCEKPSNARCVRSNAETYKCQKQNYARNGGEQPQNNAMQSAPRTPVQHEHTPHGRVGGDHQV